MLIIVLVIEVGVFSVRKCVVVLIFFGEVMWLSGMLVRSVLLFWLDR